MMTKINNLPKLGQIYKTLEAEWQSWLRWRVAEYAIPTEYVIYEPQLVAPRLGRAFNTELYLKNHKPVGYDELSADPSFVGTYREVSIVLVEVWTNRGSDGHVDWEQVGWRFVPNYCMQFPSYDKRLKLPEPMQLQYWEFGR